MPSTPPRNPRPSRSAFGRHAGALLAALALVVPVGLACWSLVTTRELDDQISRSRAMTLAYEHVDSDLRAVEAAWRAYDPRDKAAGRRDFGRALWNLRARLAKLQASADPGERHFAGELQEQVGRDADAATRLFALLDDGRFAAAWRAVSESRGFSDGAIASRLRTALARERAIAEDAFSTQRDVQRVGLASAAALAGLLFVFIVGPTRRYKRAAEGMQRRELERLTEVVLTDNLTGLRNHRAFQEDLTRELARRNRQGGALALMMVDLDGLKETNDTHGHQAGDERIRALADCLRATLRGSDVAYRVGGDEFTVILPGERAWGAFEYAQRLARAAQAAGAGVAIGITETMEVELKDAVVRRADLALIEAKRSHRTAVIYSAGLEPARVKGQPRDTYSQVLATTLARAVDAKDSGTGNHCETVSELSVRIGQQLGLGADRLEKLRVAGLLHDVGKVGIADAILQKTGPLTTSEAETMRAHVRIGHSILRTAEFDDEAEWVLHHHERLDGRGYPDGLAGEEIPLESRVILVADSYEAMTSDRPYRNGIAAREAIRELERHAGSQFDPRCVAALRAALGLPARADEPEETGTVVPIRRASAG